MRKSSWVLLGVATLATGIYESAFLGSAPFPFYLLHPILPACVLLLMLNKRLPAYLAVGVAGTLVDLLSAAPAGWVTIRWLCVLLVVDLLSESVATNRSLYAAMALVGSARLLDRVLGQIISWFALIFLHQTIILGSWTAWLGSAIVDQACTAMVFILITLFTKRFVIAINPRQVRYE